MTILKKLLNSLCFTGVLEPQGPERFVELLGLGGLGGQFGRVLGRLGGVLGRPGGVLAASWGLPGASWGVLGASWDRLGASRGRLGRHFLASFSELVLGAILGAIF